MDENKEKLTGGAPDNAENIHDEMEELAKVFKEELAKAKQEAESLTDGLENLQVEGYNPQTVSFGEKTTPISEDKLCEYCGEKLRGTEKDPDSPYCSECEEILEKYPYDYRGVIATALMICVVVAAIFLFAVNVPVFSSMKQAEKEADAGRLYTAMSKYDDAVEYAENISAKNKCYNLYAKRAILNYRMVSMNSALIEISENIPEAVTKLLTFKEVDNILTETERMQASAMVVQQHLAKYPEVSDKYYDDIISELEGLIGKKVYIKGTEYHDETEKDFTPDGTETEYICDEGWVRMYQYAAAQELGKEPEVIAEFLQKTADSSQYMKTLVASLLANTYANIGEFEKAEKLSDELKTINNESAESYMVKSVIYRYRDKDYEKAISTCEKGLEILGKLSNGENYVMQYGYMLQTQKALNYIMLDKIDLAYESATNAYDNLSLTGALTIQIRDLYALLSLATGNSEAFEALELEIDSYGDDSIAFSSDVTDYRSGKKTLKEIAESGRYDLI